MESFSATVYNEGQYETYEQPQLAGIQVDEETVELEFDPVHSGGLSLTCDREDLIELDVKV